MFSSVLMVLLALCVLAAGFLTLKRELAASTPTFTSKKETKDEMVHLFQDRGFFYLTGIALLMLFVYKQGHLSHLISFRHFWQVQVSKHCFISLIEKAQGSRLDS
ncbi:hypothetical protein P5490_006125 [Bacillus altitudinis]|uniref:hypothetical protein n=1 Tax=Bacillus altitudinis TaxID=293387 RepID=UPI0037EC5B70|nr:hypothetical protein [Bacillus altitudinis]